MPAEETADLAAEIMGEITSVVTTGVDQEEWTIVAAKDIHIMTVAV